MPDLDGISFVKKARKKLPDAAFVMLSQVSDKEMISRAYTAGIEFFIQKPVNSIEVINVLQKVIKAQSLERAAQSAKTLLEQLSAPIFDDDMSSDTDIKVNRTPSDSVDYEAKLRRILQKLGILGERGSNDIITVVCYLCENDMDLNAGLIITGEKTIEQVGEEAFAKLLRVLSGEMTKNEAIQYFSAIDIHCLGPVI